MATQHHLQADADLDDVLSDSDQLLIAEALGKLKEAKQEAYQLSLEISKPGGRAFEPHDFGIPQIDKLLKRF